MVFNDSEVQTISKYLDDSPPPPATTRYLEHYQIGRWELPWWVSTGYWERSYRGRRLAHIWSIGTRGWRASIAGIQPFSSVAVFETMFFARNWCDERINEATLIPHGAVDRPYSVLPAAAVTLMVRAGGDSVWHRQRCLRKVSEVVSAMKRSGRCADCGLQYAPTVMEFDHVRGVKVSDIATLSRSSDWHAVRAEIAKCDLVCANCHRARTHERHQKRKNAPRPVPAGTQDRA